MSIMRLERIKALIELSETKEEADAVIDSEMGFKTIREKAAFITGMFDFIPAGKIIGQRFENEKCAETFY